MNAFPQRAALRSEHPEEMPTPFEWLPDLFSFLGRHRHVIALSTMLATSAGLLDALVSRPRFTATSVILIDPQRADVFQQKTPIADAQGLSALVESEVEVLRSQGLARDVVRQIGITGDLKRPSQSRVETTTAEAKAVEKLQRMLSVHRVGLTYVIDVELTASSPTESARLANAVVDTYIQDGLDARSQSTREASAWLQDRLAELRGKALTADKSVQAYKEHSGIVDTEHGVMDEQQVGELNSRLIAATDQAAELQARVNRIDAVLRQGAIASSSTTEALHDSIITDLRQRYFDDARQESAVATQYGESHQVATKLRAEMSELQSSIAAELRNIDNAARSEFQVADADRSAVQAALDRVIQTSEVKNEARVTLRSLTSLADTYHALYGNFLQRYTEAAQDQSFPVSEARLVTRAIPPLRKSGPKRLLLVSAAALLGLAAGLGFACATELRFSGLRDEDAVWRLLGMNCLGIIPAARSKTLTVGRIGSDQRQRRLSQAFQRLGVRVSRRLPDGRHIVVGVAAHGQVAGRAFVEALGEALSSIGLSVVVMRKQSIEASVLAIDHRDQYSCTPLTQVATANTIKSALPVATGDASRPLAELKEQYDIVLVEMPPVSAIFDMQELSGGVETMILVLPWGRTRAAEVRSALGQADLAPNHVLGVVLADADGRFLAQNS